MTTLKTSTLTGAALDWAVAKCEGMLRDNQKASSYWQPSTDWAQGGQIIEMEKINMIYRQAVNRMNLKISSLWIASVVTHGAEGPTPLIAAMRCYVASKLGDEVDVPSDLT